MWYVYVLKSGLDGRLYVGISQQPDERLQYHNRGKVKSTSFYRPWMRVYLEEIGTTEKARQREKYLKSGKGKVSNNP